MKKKARKNKKAEPLTIRRIRDADGREVPMLDGRCKCTTSGVKATINLILDEFCRLGSLENGGAKVDLAVVRENCPALYSARTDEQITALLREGIPAGKAARPAAVQIVCDVLPRGEHKKASIERYGREMK
jgi:hypothetical protein